MLLNLRKHYKYFRREHRTNTSYLSVNDKRTANIHAQILSSSLIPKVTTLFVLGYQSLSIID